MITCSINNIEIVKALYSDVSGVMKKAQDSKKDFDHMDYMKKLFKDLSEQGSPEVAAKYLQSVPKIIIDLQNNYFENLPVDLNALSRLNIKFKNLETGASEVIKELSDVSDLNEKKSDIENEKSNEINLNQDPVVPKPVVRLPQRFRTLSPFGGTLQSYIKVNPNLKDQLITPESINQELMYMIRTFDRIKEIQNTTDTLDGIIYDGVKLHFKSITLNAYATPQNEKYLDSDTRALILTARSIVKDKEGVISAKNLPILLLSDVDGNILYFDNDGKITTENLGKPVYQFMRTVRKEGNNFSVTNMYNTEDLLITPEDFTDATYDQDIDGPKDKYLASVKEMMKKEMSDLYDIQQRVISGKEMILPITGISNGIPANLSSSKIFLNDLLKLPTLNENPNNILKSINTIPIEQDGYVAGSAFIELNGNKFFIQRPLITQELAVEIANVLTNPNIPNDIKQEYTDQFFKNLDTNNTSKKFNLIYSNKGIYFNTFKNFESDEKTGPALQLHDVYLKKLDESQIEEYKKTIIKYLTEEGLKKNKGRINIIFQNKALESGRYMRLNDAGTGFNRDADYHAFLATTKSEISLTGADPGFYNYVVNFTTFDSPLGEFINSEPSSETITLIDNEINNLYNYANSKEYRNIVKEQDPTQQNPFLNFLFTRHLIDKIYNVYSQTQNKALIQALVDRINSPQKGYLDLRDSQKKMIQDALNRTNFKTVTPEPTAKPPIEEQINEGIASKNNSPENNTPVNDVFEEGTVSEKNKKYFEFERSGIKPEFINPLKIRQAKSWWNSKEMEPMRKLIEFGQLTNIVNSDVYARFIVAGATLADTGVMGTIKVNEKMGSIYQNLTIYHEAWHVFSQLFLTKQQKLDLYNELKNYKDAKGNTPYSKMSFRELEEMLAEDFRNYVKTGKAKQAAPKRNTLFRKIVEFLKQLFGKVLKKFKKQDIVIDSLNSPMAKELFDNLYLGQFNKYTPNITNADFTELDRGPRQVEYPSQDALSPGDGMTVVSSIDNFFAEKINELQIESKSVGVGLSALMNPKYKSYLYKDAKSKFEEILKQEQAKLNAIEGIVDFNTLNTLEEIESNAFAIMRNEVYDKEGKLIPEKSGKDKYFFLTSQVTDFGKLSASTKKGERVRGEDYKDTIRIVGDFYKHKTIKKDGRSIDIVLVTRPQDAQTQFDNYTKGGAKIFTKLEQKPTVDKAKIDQTQEEIRDNVRVLQTVIENWGDEKSGIVKYHMENTAYEVSRKKYSVDGELLPEIEEVKVDSKDNPKDEEENTGGLEAGNDGTGELSLQQTMSKETIFILKTLFKVNSDGTIPTDRFGLKERADFSKTFAIVAKTIGGIRDRKQAYEKLKEESQKFPELKQLFETKFPDPNKSGATVNTFEFDIARNFFQDFGKPHINYLQLYGYYEKINFNNVESNQLNFVVKESDLAIDNLINKWSNNFSTLKRSDFINVSRDNVRTLKLGEIVKQFKSKSTEELNLDKQIEFAKVLGIELQNNDNVKNELKRYGHYGLPYMFKIVNSIHKLEQKSIVQPLSNEEARLVNTFKENPVKVLVDGFNASLIGGKGTVKELTQLKNLAELQTTYGYDSSSTAIIRSNQNVGYKEVNWSSGHARAYALNEVENFNQLWEDPRYNYMSHLNPEINTHVRHLKIISSLFPDLTKKRTNSSVNFFAQDGFAITDAAGESSGNTTTELDPLSKFIFEFHSFSLAGVAELPRTSEKKFSWGFKVEGGINHPEFNFKTAKDPNLYIDIDMFKTIEGEQYARAGFLYGYIQGEFDRIKKFRGPEKEKYLNFTGYNEPVIEDGEKLASGQTFVAFKGILSEPTKKRLYALADQQADIEILDYVKNVDQELGEMIKKDITTFFNEKTNELKELYFNKIPYISRSLLEKFGIDKESLKDEKKFESYLKDPNIINALLKAYTYNDFIHKYETSIIMFGDHAQWNHGKEDWSKRIPGLTSDGIGFMFDNQTQNFINDVFNKETYASKLTEKEGINYNTFHFSEKMNAAVIKDAERRSIYIDDIEPLWEQDYLKRFSPEVAKEKAAADAKAYKEMKESDGIAFVTLDVYRTLKKTGRGWSLAEEALYKKIINGEQLEDGDAREFFSIYKLHYFGTLENDLLPVTGMFKFSVMPIIPGVNATPGSELDKLHKKMMRQNTQLVLFASGSKGSHITSDGKTDNIFTNKEDRYINTEVNEKGEDVFQFTKNPFYLANLKEVTVMNNSFKGHLPIATQTRAITLDNLFEDGELKNPDNKPFVDEYTNSIREYSKVLKEDLLNGLGLELIDGRVIGDFTRFVEIIRNEMSQRDVPDHLIKLVNTTLKGELAMDLSLHPESDSIEKLLVSLIQRGVVKQQTNGEPLVQAPATFTNGIWDTPYLDLDKIKEIQKYLGTNTLPFYLVNGKTRSEEMKVAIALQGDFKNLLNALDLEGKKIETIDRLNELIKNPKWFSENKRSLLLFGPRIPNDAHNTIEAATVWHFLPESFGNTIITPTEIVAKAGSDFDGDKLFMSMPNIDSEGNFIDKGVENFEKTLEETKELEKKKKLPKDALTSKQLINLQKRYLQNRYLQASVEILMLPENAVTLTKPNGTYLVDRYEKNVTEFRTGYDKFKNVNNRPSDVNAKGTKIPSPSSHFTAAYNLYVHDANLSLGDSLGILAKLTKSIPMYKAAGAKMPAKYNATSVIKVPLDVRFIKNTTKNSKGETVISIGGENNVAGENISDTTSHSLQGVLDRAKATFPFELKLVPEAMNVYGYLTRAGVDQEDIVYLLNQPLVSQYLDLQKRNQSPIYNTIFEKQQKYMIGQQLFKENIKKTLSQKQLENLFSIINQNKLKAVLKSLPADLELQVFFPKKEVRTGTVSELRNQLNKGLNPNIIYSISTQIKDDEGNSSSVGVYSSTPATFDNAGFLLSNANIYFFIDYIAKNTLANKDQIQKSDLVDIMQNQDTSSLKALMIFAHYIELERQYSAMGDFEKSFTPDTAKLSTIQEAIIRKKKFASFYSREQKDIPEYLRELDEIDQDFLKNMMEQSVVSSLIFDDLTVDLLKPVFTTKTDTIITNFIGRSLSDPYKIGDITRAFGKGADGKAEFIRKFGNTFINYIYQNYETFSYDENGKLSNLPESFDSKEVVVDNTIDQIIKIEKDRILVNSFIIENDFAEKAYLENNNTERAYSNRNYDTFKIGQDPFKNLRSFYRYHLELALLEKNNSIDYLMDNDDYFSQIVARNDNNVTAAYIQYISERALTNSRNPYYIMGLTKYSYYSNLLDLINSLQNYPAIFDRFPILSQISQQRNREGFKIVKLNDRADVKGAFAQDYYTQIRQLGDISIQKLDNPTNDPIKASKDKRISEIFNLFSLMMYYQHGVGKSGTSFNNALDSSQYKAIIMSATQAFMGNYLNPQKNAAQEINGLLEIIYSQTVNPQRFKILTSGKFTFLNSSIEKKYQLLEEERSKGKLEVFELNEGSQEIPTEFTKGDKIILDEDVRSFKKYLISSVGVKPHKFKTKETKFPVFYNGMQQGMPDSVSWILNNNNLYDMVEMSQDSDLAGTVYYENVDLETGYQMFKKGEGPTQPGVSQTNKPKGEEVKEGIYVNQGALTKEEQLELFNYLKPFLEEQAAKTLKAANASKMIGLGLRWDYKTNNVGRQAVEIPDVINPGNKTKYGYYNESINGQPLGEITPRFRELMQKATGVDMTNYDGAIINLYEKDTFISSHNDVDESRSAIKYPVIGINLGGKGNFSIERLGPENAMLDLQAGTGYIFGVDGINRDVWHRTFPTPQDSFLPELTTKIDGKTYPAGSYRVTITMRRVMPLTEGMPEAPSIVSTQPTTAPVASTNNPAEFTNHSGGAYGGDTFWDIIGREFGVTNHMHYKDAGNVNLSQKLRNAGVKATVLTKEQMDAARDEVERLLGEKYPDTIPGNLKVRNYYQVANADAVFAIAELNGDSRFNTGSVFGGTNVAVQLGIKLDKPVYVWDISSKNWHKYNPSTKEFELTDTPILTKNFAGVGSRDIESYNVQKEGKWVPREQYKGKEVEEAAKQAIRDVYVNTFKATTQPTQAPGLPGPETTINIYAGTGENAELSNFAVRPFITGSFTDSDENITFNTVEGAFQAAKLAYTSEELSWEEADAIQKQLQKATGPEAKAIGKKIKGLDTESWDYYSFDVMRTLLTESFEQNPDALAKLLATGNATLTHTQDKTKWGTEFPKLLMEVRDELRATQPTGSVKGGGSESSINTDMEEYQKLVEASNGVQPKTFTVGTRTWNLNKFGNYDWSDPTTNQIYMRNVDMETGKSVPEPGMNDPVDPKLIENSLNFIDNAKKLFDVETVLAQYGYDLNDLLKELEEVKTMQDYFKVKEKFDKLCQ